MKIRLMKNDAHSATPKFRLAKNDIDVAEKRRNDCPGAQ